MRGAQNHAERRTPQPQHPQAGRQQQRPCRPIDRLAAVQVEQAEGAGLVDVQAVVAAVFAQADRQEVEHLRERQRDHDEADARRAQAHRAHRQRHQRGHADADGQLHPAIADSIVAKDAYRIAAQAQEHGVAEADQAGKAQHQVQRQRRQRVDQDARAQGHVKGFTQPLRDERNRGQDQEQQRQHPAPVRRFLHDGCPCMLARGSAPRRKDQALRAKRQHHGHQDVDQHRRQRRPHRIGDGRVEHGAQ
ncbi:hypothetical protein D3C85_1238580 [compost metagenome]